jgi:hypothetical protein
MSQKQRIDRYSAAMNVQTVQKSDCLCRKRDGSRTSCLGARVQGPKKSEARGAMEDKVRI